MELSQAKQAKNLLWRPNCPVLRKNKEEYYDGWNHLFKLLESARPTQAKIKCSIQSKSQYQDSIYKQKAEYTKKYGKSDY